MVTDLFDPTVDCSLDTINDPGLVFVFVFQYLNMFVPLVFVLMLFFAF